MSTENLFNEEAIEKLKTLAEKTDIGMLCTYSKGASYVHAVPMSTQEVDEEGNMWFLFSSESSTFQNLQEDKKISVLYSDIKNYNFLSVRGSAVVSTDKARIEKYWNKMIEAWFEKGKDDPAIRILQVKPDEADYWDNKTNKLVTFFKVAVSAVSGEKLDIGRTGKLDL